ncbi:hypothetical protein U1Q18_002501, partial [Sarracenia purpurea var. burkii]
AGNAWDLGTLNLQDCGSIRCRETPILYEPRLLNAKVCSTQRRVVLLGSHVGCCSVERHATLGDGDHGICATRQWDFFSVTSLSIPRCSLGEKSSDATPVFGSSLCVKGEPVSVVKPKRPWKLQRPFQSKEETPSVGITAHSRSRGR